MLNWVVKCDLWRLQPTQWQEHMSTWPNRMWWIGFPTGSYNPSDCFFCSSCNDVWRVRTSWFRWGRNSKCLEYTCDTAGGMSGSPVMTDDHDSSSTLYSYGVHPNGVGSGSRNKGVRITRNYFYDICRWKCNTGARCSELCWVAEQIDIWLCKHFWINSGTLP